MPLVFFIWLSKNESKPKYGIIELMWWSPDFYLSNPDILPKESHPNINSTDINLTGNDINDKEKLDFARLQIRDLVKSNDSLKGVHFHFGINAKYWTFIRSIEMCKFEKAEVYIPYKNDIWVLNRR